MIEQDWAVDVQTGMNKAYCVLIQRFRGVGEYYRSYRQDLGHAILLGLELLIAGHIIRTVAVAVAVAPTLQNVLVLGLIVLFRTFLSLSLQLEIEGRLPWHREGSPADQMRQEEQH